MRHPLPLYCSCVFSSSEAETRRPPSPVVLAPAELLPPHQSPSASAQPRPPSLSLFSFFPVARGRRCCCRVFVFFSSPLGRAVAAPPSHHRHVSIRRHPATSAKPQPHDFDPPELHLSLSRSSARALSPSLLQPCPTPPRHQLTPSHCEPTPSTPPTVAQLARQTYPDVITSVLHLVVTPPNSPFVHPSSTPTTHRPNAVAVILKLAPSSLSARAPSRRRRLSLSLHLRRASPTSRAPSPSPNHLHPSPSTSPRAQI